MFDVGEMSDVDVAGLRLMQMRSADCPEWAASLNDCEVSDAVHHHH